MNPVKIGTGKSFKGLAAYLLHDPDRAETAERVGWTQSYNLDDADPDRAWRLMADTAMSADALKEAAGIKKGKAAKNTVYHFSITFGPDEQPGEKIERAAVAVALKALGMQDHQALAVRHTDTDHAHIHVMVNLIDPATGMSAASKQRDGRPALLSNDTRKLSTWAAKFERDHGLKINEGRLENANKRAEGEFVDASRKERNVYEREKAETTDRRQDMTKAKFDKGAAKLAAKGRELREEHELEWVSYKGAYKAERDALSADGRDRFKQAREDAKQEFKGRWAGMFMRHRSELQDFERGDRTAIGKIWHAAAVLKDRVLDGDALGGFVAAFSRDERRAIVQRRHQHERQEVLKELRLAIRQKTREARFEAEQSEAAAREAYSRARTELKERQAKDRQTLRQEWKDLNAERKKALAVVRPQVFTPRQDRGHARNVGRGRGMEPEL